jgi:hypothetical protein
MKSQGPLIFVYRLKREKIGGPNFHLHGDEIFLCIVLKNLF